MKNKIKTIFKNSVCEDLNIVGIIPGTLTEVVQSIRLSNPELDPKNVKKTIKDLIKTGELEQDEDIFMNQDAIEVSLEFIGIPRN